MKGSYEFILGSLAVWTLMEGGGVLAFPGAAVRILKKILPKQGSYWEVVPKEEIRKFGAIELMFGLALGIYLLMFT